MSLLRALRSAGIGLAAGRAQPAAPALLTRASLFSTEAAPAAAPQRKPYDPSTLTPRERLLQEFNQRLFALTQPDSRKKAYLARDVVDEMRMAGIKPNYVTYHTAIVAAMHSKRLQDVLYFLKEMTESGRTPDTKTYNAVFSTCARAGQSATAKEILDDMNARGVQWDHRTVTSVLNACAATGDTEMAEDIRARAEAGGIEINEFMISALMRAYTAQRFGTTKEKKMKNVLRLLEDSRRLCKGEEKVPPIVFDSYVACLVLLNENEEALRVYNDREKEGQTIRTASLEAAVTAQLRVGLPRRIPGKNGKRPEHPPEATPMRMENLKAAITLNEHAKAQGVVPNLATRTALVNAAAKLQQDLPEDPELGVMLEKVTADALTKKEWYTGPEDAARWITILTDGRAGSRGVEYALKVFNHLEERRLPMQQEALQRLRDALETRTPALAAEAVPRVATALLTAKPSRSAARKAREEAEGRGEGGADGLASQ